MSTRDRPRSGPTGLGRAGLVLFLGLVAVGCSTIDNVQPQAAVRGETTVRPAATTTTTGPTASLGVPQSTVAVDRVESTVWETLAGAYTVEIVETLPHDPTAFTQGLLQLPDGTLVESTGLVGDSRRQRLNADGGIESLVELDAEVFGSALALASGALHHFWLEGGEVVIADPVTLAEIDRRPFADPVWGACGLGDQVITSNGSSALTVRDAALDPVATVNVSLGGEPVSQLNELACLDGLAFANIWLQPGIVVIDLDSGAVVATIDASSLAPGNPLGADDVLNGIAIDDDSETLWLTGKRWDTLFRVRLVPAG